MAGYEVLPLPTGEPATYEITNEIAATVRELEACINTGFDLRYFSFFSDAWIGRITTSDEIEAEFRAMAAAPPTPIPDGQHVLFPGPWHVAELEDGRVLAAVLWFIDEDADCLDLTRTNALILVQDDDRWIIDQVIEYVPNFNDVVDAVGPPPAAILAGLPAPCEEIAAASTQMRPLNALTSLWLPR